MTNDQEGNVPFDEDEDLFPNARWDERADDTAKRYAEAIRDEIYELDGSQIGNVSFSHEMVASSDQNLKARSVMIRTNLGAVVVLPDFRKKSASAMILNLGVIRAMKQEGYTSEYIQENGKIYGDVKPFDKKNVELFAYYLTHKI